MPPHADVPGLRQGRTTAQSRPRPARRVPAALAGAASVLAISTPAAAGQSPSDGGAAAGPRPSVISVTCRRHCAGTQPAPGSVVAMDGSRLRAVVEVTFLGTRAAGDETAARPYRTSPHRLVVAVPPDAVRGRVVAEDSTGTASAPSPVVKLVKPATPKRNGGPVATVVTGKKAFFDGLRRPTLTFALTTGRPAATTVQVVREADGAAVATFDEGVVQPGETRSVAWDGTVLGRPQPDGRYAFVVHATDLESGATASTAQAGPAGGAQGGAVARSADRFELLGHRFPVRGKHHFGDFGASFGGGRGHEGQDVFAACGTRLVAARGGVVKLKRFQSRAGHYIVIDGERTDVDMAYMHLRDAALVEQGERVRTGQLIGHVGDTGRASGCHLHFEMWSGPGWYTGGSPVDPLPHLRAWDAVS